MNKHLGSSWLYVISSNKKLISLNFNEIWYYRDLLLLFVKRDIVTLYKQTILGPLWYLIQPLFTSLIFTLIFNNIANISIGKGVPAFLFNMAGITCWNYFKECLTGTSDTFRKNQNIFGKVYFPRVIMPMSVVVSNLLKFGIQLFILMGFYVFFKCFTDIAFGILIQKEVIILPILILAMGLLGLGFGMVVSSMTTKYRDLTFLITFGVQLLMYASGVMYPVSLVQDKVSQGVIPVFVGRLIEFNPMTIIVEAFRYVILSVGDFSIYKVLYSLMFSVVIFLIGLVIFNRTEQSFIDTV